MSDRLLRGPSVAVCYLVAFWSGFFVMGVELLGGRLLGEGDRGLRLLGAACIAGGVIALALG